MPTKPRTPKDTLATRRSPALREGAEGWVKVRVEKVIEGVRGPRAAVSVHGYGLSRLTLDADAIELERAADE